jgi:putative transposase
MNREVHVRFWESVGLQCPTPLTYLHAFETGSELRAGLSRWIDYYNVRRPHSTLAGRTPDEAYGATDMERLAA